MIESGWKLFEIVGKDWYEAYYWLKLAKNGWKWLTMARNGQQWLNMAKMDFKLMEIDGNCQKWHCQDILC